MSGECWMMSEIVNSEIVISEIDTDFNPGIKEKSASIKIKA